MTKSSNRYERITFYTTKKEETERKLSNMAEHYDLRGRQSEVSKSKCVGYCVDRFHDEIYLKESK